MIGRTISHYRIVSVLGQGGSGTVYKAEDTRLKRHVALKFLTPRPGKDLLETERLIREARAASKIDHRNVCTIYEVDEADGQTFIAMACVEGADLSRRIAEGPIPQEEALGIALQMAQGLREAHLSGIVHGDIKPTNLMLTPRGEIRITDFGLAELFEPALDSDRETTSGTVAYMSPEQLRTEEIDHRSDIWSLGVVLYEMLTGKKPFEGAYAQAIVYGVLNLDPTPVDDVRDDVSPEVSRIVSRAIEKSRDRRYQDIDEFISDLEGVSGTACKPGEVRRPIAVISFENLTGDPAFDYLQRAIPNLLITSLERSEHLRVITWERMRDLLRQLGKDDVHVIDPDLGFQISRLEALRAIVVGSFTKAGDTFATDAKVLDVRTKKLIASSGTRGLGVSSILSGQVDELSRQILEGLGMEERHMKAVERPITEVTTTSLEAYESFLKGKDFYERLYNAEARRLLEEAVDIDPDFAEAYLYLAWTYTRLRQPGDRDNALSRAMALSKRATRKERLYIEAAYARTIEQDRAKEFRILKSIAREFPGEKLVHHRLAGYHRVHGELYRAVEEYNKALALDPGFGWSMNELAYMYTDVRDFEKATEYFEKYAEASPGDANPIDSMGELFFRMGRLDEAITKYKEALELNPDFYYAYWEIAYVSALKEDYDTALAWIEGFIEHAPSFGTVAEGHRWRCLYKFWVGRLAEALADADLIADLAREEESELWTTEAERMRAWVLYGSNRLSEARESFEVCLASINRNPRAFIPAATSYSAGSLEQVDLLRATHELGLGLLDVREGQPDAARARLARISGAKPEHATLLEAEAFLAQGHADRAVALLEVEEPEKPPYMTDTEGLLSYNLPPLRDTLARAYEAQGESYKAITEYERLTTIDPESGDRRLIHPKYHSQLARLYEAKGWIDRAVERYEAFLNIDGDADEGVAETASAREKLMRSG